MEKSKEEEHEQELRPGQRGRSYAGINSEARGPGGRPVLVGAAGGRDGLGRRGSRGEVPEGGGEATSHRGRGSERGVKVGASGRQGFGASRLQAGPAVT